MTRYAIYAGDQLYGGLHGMCTHMVVECNSIEDAVLIAREESIDVIQSYSGIYETLDNDIAESIEENVSEDEMEEYRNDVYNEDIDYNIWLINEEKAQNFTTDELDEMFYNLPEGFIEKYCIEIK